MHVVFLAFLPWYAILLVYMLLDFLLDWIWYGLFFWWCLPCAWIFIWLFNIVFIPFTVWGYVQRLQMELVGFVFDFWLLFFNGDGCFLRWGNNCWVARKIPQRDNISYMDSIAFHSAPVDNAPLMNRLKGQIDGMLDWVSSQMTIPTQESFLSDDWFAVGKEKRAALAETCPGMPETQAFFEAQFNSLIPVIEDFYTKTFDF